jgi:hypothetical protein
VWEGSQTFVLLRPKIFWNSLVFWANALRLLFTRDCACLCLIRVDMKGQLGSLQCQCDLTLPVGVCSRSHLPNVHSAETEQGVAGSLVVCLDQSPVI